MQCKWARQYLWWWLPCKSRKILIILRTRTYSESELSFSNVRSHFSLWLLVSLIVRSQPLTRVVRRSLSSDECHVKHGRPILRFPAGRKSKALRSICFSGLRTTWPQYFNRWVRHFRMIVLPFSNTAILFDFGGSRAKLPRLRTNPSSICLSASRFSFVIVETLRPYKTIGTMTVW